MGEITVRRLNATVFAALDTRAKASGRSIEDEVQALIEEATRDAVAAIRRAQAAEQRAFLKRLQRHRQDFFGDRLAPESVSRFLEAEQPQPTARERVLDEA